MNKQKYFCIISANKNGGMGRGFNGLYVHTLITEFILIKTKNKEKEIYTPTL